MDALVPEKTYVDVKTQEHVVFKWMSSNGKFAIVHPVGEPDMQSMYGVPPRELSLTTQEVGV